MSDPRPFYHRFAWAYDLLVNEPIDARIAAIVTLLGKRGVRPGDEVVDAGCGTGRYASELASRGFRVLGFDSSAEMVEVARKRQVAANLEFSTGDLTSFKHPRQFRAILCRGVLNDLLTDKDREQVARQFVGLLAPGGVLLLDVRDWLRTVDRCRIRPRTIRAIDLADGGRLTFQSETTLDPLTRQMLISETFKVRGAGSTHVEWYSTDFRMRCWSASELHDRFAPWFENVDILPDYVAPPAWTDRLVLVGTRPKGKRLRRATSLQITPITVAHLSMDALRSEASAEGFPFLDRLIRNWEAGANRFDQPGECLLGAWSGAELVGVGGINRDPYIQGSGVGRIRHLYVRRSARRSGVGSALLQRLLNEASSTFYLVRVRTDTCDAAAFYLRHGFLPVADAFASHVKSLR